MYRFTPWAAAALAAAGVTAEEIRAMEPPGYRLTGHARSSGGPWTFRLHNEAEGSSIAAVAFRLDEVRDALERLTGRNALEDQLAASLRARE